VRNEKNLGFLKNCNHAASHARGKYIHFLNNDTEVKQGWLSSLVRLMESDGSIGLSGSKLVYPNGKLQEAGGIIWNDASGWNFGNRQNPEMPEFNYVKEVDYISGASMLVRKSLWEELGGF
jgi:GT2 family glycosyltransferase